MGLAVSGNRAYGLSFRKLSQWRSSILEFLKCCQPQRHIWNPLHLHVHGASVFKNSRGGIAAVDISGRDSAGR
jgi:hypothetical protein